MSEKITRVCLAISAILTVLFITMLVVVNLNAASRYSVSHSFPWTEELTRYSMIWMVMLGAAVLALFDDHIALSIPMDRWPAAIRHAHKIVVHGLVLLISCVVAWTGLHFAVGIADATATAVQVSMAYPASAIPVGFSLIAIASCIVLYNDIAAATGLRPVPLPLQKRIMDNSFKHVGDDAAEAGGHEPKVH